MSSTGILGTFFYLFGSLYQVIRHFCSILSADSIRSNLVLVYEILLEIVVSIHFTSSIPFIMFAECMLNFQYVILRTMESFRCYHQRSCSCWCKVNLFCPAKDLHFPLLILYALLMMLFIT